MKKHTYKVTLEWTGNEGKGTSGYRTYNRNHNIQAEGKVQTVLGSSDPSFLGDPERYNPEELFLSSIAACHMLWFLHLCAVNKIIVLDYQDEAQGTMTEDDNGSGRFTEVTLFPKVKVKDSSMVAQANKLHEEANRMCFIANSCNFEIHHSPKTVVA